MNINRKINKIWKYKNLNKLKMINNEQISKTILILFIIFYLFIFYKLLFIIFT